MSSSTRAALARLALALLAIAGPAGCGRSEREQFEAVEAAVQRSRDAPKERPDEIRAAADKLAVLEVDHPKAISARDACATAEHDRAELFELVQKTQADVRSATAQTDPTLLAERFKKIDDLQERLPARHDLCSQRMSELWTGR
ncbi:MAG: hypothetical protein IPM79_22665 [Polyangiaceae bacterium]|nr:hypothetical protein [Polyangiaceae bacterium]